MSTAPGTRQPYIKMQFFLKRKEGMSADEFHKYWEEDHARYILNIPGFRHVTKRYSQFHPMPEFQSKAALLGVETLDFDGVSELWVESVEGYAEYMGQAELVEAAKKEGARFMGPGTKVLVGYESLVIGDS